MAKSNLKTLVKQHIQYAVYVDSSSSSKACQTCQRPVRHTERSHHKTRSRTWRALRSSCMHKSMVETFAGQFKGGGKFRKSGFPNPSSAVLDTGPSQSALIPYSPACSGLMPCCTYSIQYIYQAEPLHGQLQLAHMAMHEFQVSMCH